MRTLLGFTGVLLWLGCATAGQQYYQEHYIEVRIQNNHGRAVDVQFFCGGSERQAFSDNISIGEARTVRVRAGRGCDFRVKVRRSIEGGPMTEKPRYDSEDSLHGSGDCAVLDLRPNPNLPSTLTLPKGCP